MTKNIGTDEGLKKIKHYCSYQERSHKEVKEKLYSFGLYKQEVETLLSQLIEEDYLNEERFAIAFAGGHFRIKEWGKVKINYELRQKGVSDYNIRKALAAIDDTEYQTVLNKLYEAKLNTLRSEKNVFTKKAKVQAFLLQRGYEQEEVGKLISKLGEK